MRADVEGRSSSEGLLFLSGRGRLGTSWHEALASTAAACLLSALSHLSK